VLVVGRHVGEDWLHFYIKSSVRSQDIMMTVDHAMRKRAEAAYLTDLCILGKKSQLHFCVSVHVNTIPRGIVVE
jgi:hypothetical protein